MCCSYTHGSWQKTTNGRYMLSSPYVHTYSQLSIRAYVFRSLIRAGTCIDMLTVTRSGRMQSTCESWHSQYEWKLSELIWIKHTELLQCTKLQCKRAVLLTLKACTFPSGLFWYIKIVKWCTHLHASTWPESSKHNSCTYTLQHTNIPHPLIRADADMKINAQTLIYPDTR